MPFVPHGKKSKAKRDRSVKVEAREQVIDWAVSVAHHVMPLRGLCLPQCVLVERLLGERLPPPQFTMKLGALRVFPEGSAGDPIFYDPRGPGGIEDGFHAWLEQPDGRLLDPSICLTLHADGYDVNPAEYTIAGGRSFSSRGHVYLYEELADLEMIGLAETEPVLESCRRVAYGLPPGPPGDCLLDVRWRNGARSPR